MPDDFDTKLHRYRTANGHLRTREELRRSIDKLTDHVKREAKRLALAVDAKEITPVEFEIAMRELLKSAHVVAATVGRGGKEQMEQSDWGVVGNKLRWQYAFLARFARQILAAAVAGPRIASRAEKYASAIHISFYRANHAELKSAGSDTGPPVDDDGKKIKVRLVQNSKEGCSECKADAARGWVLVEDMGEIGSRKCGDYCRCDLHFSTDDPNYSGPGNQLD